MFALCRAEAIVLSVLRAAGCHPVLSFAGRECGALASRLAGNPLADGFGWITAGLSCHYGPRLPQA